MVRIANLNKICYNKVCYNKVKGGDKIEKFIAGFLIGVILATGLTVFAEVISFVAEKATFDVYVAGEKFESEKPPVVIEGSTYLPLKATGEALGVDVTWNGYMQLCGGIYTNYHREWN